VKVDRSGLCHIVQLAHAPDILLGISTVPNQVQELDVTIKSPNQIHLQQAHLNFIARHILERDIPANTYDSVDDLATIHVMLGKVARTPAPNAPLFPESSA
jgi:hypothetical protein